MALAPCGGPHTASAFRYAVWFVSRSATGTPPCGLRARDHTENMGGPGGGGGVGWELGTKADYYPRVVIQHTPGSRLLFSPSLNFARHASVVPSFERRSRKRSDKNGISMSRRGGHRPRGATRGRFCLMTSPIWPLCHITPDQKKPRGCFACNCAHPLANNGAANPDDTGAPEGDLPEREKTPK